MDNQIAVFEQSKIRRIEHHGELWFSVIDIIEILAETPSPKTYWDKLKSREFQTPPFWGQLKLTAKDGKQRLTDCANTEGVFRIIQSVPSPKAEPFKLWLASLGKQAIEEAHDPELGYERLKEIYEAKGYPREWIERRLQTIEIRKQLTDEWKNRGVKEGSEYAILTAQIAKATFGLTPTEHKELKGLTKPTENLRDHMTPLELIFTALGEEMTRAMTVDNDAQGFEETEFYAQKGGSAAGKARLAAEKETNVKVISAESFLKQIETEKEKIETTGEN